MHKFKLNTHFKNSVENLVRKLPDPFGIRKTTAYVLINSQHVWVEENNLYSITKRIKRQIDEKQLLSIDQLGQKTLTSQRIFLQDSINFCFWAKNEEKKWLVEFPQKKVTGGWYSLVACFDRAIDEGIPILDANFLQGMTKRDGEHIFKGTNSIQIPLLNDRIEILRETGKILKTVYGGNFENLLLRTNYDAIKIVKTLLKEFPSFRDFSTFKGKKIQFLKRAQICAYDLSFLPENIISNIDQLTIFADYKLPQILRAFNILQYKKELAEKVDSYTNLEKDSQEELEIRAATIWACELIANELNISPSVVDNALWYLSRMNTIKVKPYHRVLTTNY